MADMDRALQRGLERAFRDLQAMSATMRNVYESIERGDEASYRQWVEIAPGDAYSDALTTTMFESIRLHQAVEKRFIREEASPADAAAAVQQPLASSRSSLADRPQPSLAAVDYRVNARAMMAAVDGWSYTLRGDRATINQLADRPAAPTLRRATGGRWVLAPAQWELPRDTATYRLAVAEERSLAQALAAARAAVMNGNAKSIEDVNMSLRSQLIAPASQPRVSP